MINQIADGMRMDIIRFASGFEKLMAVEEESVEGEIDTFRKRSASFFKDYDQQTDKLIFTAMMKMFYIIL